MTVEDVVVDLIDHAQEGVYRPGGWERIGSSKRSVTRGKTIWSRAIPTGAIGRVRSYYSRGRAGERLPANGQSPAEPPLSTGQTRTVGGRRDSN